MAATFSCGGLRAKLFVRPFRRGMRRERRETGSGNRVRWFGGPEAGAFGHAPAR
jgi:hypothetical protein